MNSIDLQRDVDRPLQSVACELFKNETAARQQEVAGEVLAFYKDGRDDVFFSIADQALSKAIANDVEGHLKRLVAQAEERSVDEVVFEFEIVRPIVLVVHKILSDLERTHRADLAGVGRILSNPDYRVSVAKLIKEKLDRYIQSFTARDIDIVDVYGNTTQYATGVAYEEHVGETFTKAGWNTLRTPVTGDQGADLVCTKAGVKLVVQCKFYTGNVGNAAVQEVHAARGFYDASHAAVVSNAGFTRSAIELAEKLGILLLPEDTLKQFVWGQTPHK